jgi:predicted aspartyl protease
MGKVDVHSIKVSHKGISNCIKSPVIIKDILFSGKTEKTLAIWDTGATNSVITKSLAEKLGLKSVSKTIVRGVHGAREVNVYYVNITLNYN